MRRYNSQYSYKPRSIRRIEQKSKRNLIIAILLLIATGYFLLTWGLPTLIDGLRLFRNLGSGETKKPAAAIEDNAIAPPILNIPYEATNTATIKVTGFASPDNKVEIYFDDELKDTVDVESDGSFITKDIELALGTNNIFGKTIDKDKKSLPSKTIKILFDNEKPKLEITEPPDNHQITGGDKKTRVSGKTDPNNNITINGSSAIVNSDGLFSTEVSLQEGDNTLSIVAHNSFGNSNEVQRKVNYKP